MMNEEARIDIASYVKRTLWSAGILFAIIIGGLITATIFEHTDLSKQLVGGLIGAMLATANIFALGYAFYGLAIAKARRWIIVWPVSTFLGMCSIAFILVYYFPAHILGFALGLTAPVVFGSAIVFAASKPA